ncbi:MAG: MgtC/SapB family protein [Planctomycetes bacterium]|nr:MgtC/SapB family protein [Planctomycetota bacterium]
MDAGWSLVLDDFGDIPTVAEGVRMAVRLAIAAALGGLVGWERARAGKEAGIRTHMLVALGSAFFVLVPVLDGMAHADVSRVIQGIATGIGFLGAGVILKPDGPDGRIKGLTTATGLWLTAALGVAVGLGRLTSAVIGALMIVGILTVVGSVERRHRR